MKPTPAHLALLLLVGCALPENFVPVDRDIALSPEGYAAADYEIIVDGERIGDVAVWTNGAKMLRSALGARTVLYVSFHVENAAAVPLQIERESISIRAGDRRIRPEAMEEIHGARVVPPDHSGWLVLRFIMPKHIDPQDLDGFTIRWTARAGDRTYTQRTPFKEYEAAAYEYPYPYLSDYYYSPFDERLHLRQGQ